MNQLFILCCMQNSVKTTNSTEGLRKEHLQLIRVNGTAYSLE